MKKYYLISWCDDNHNPYYWLNDNYLGCSLDIIVENLIDLEVPKGTKIQVIELTNNSFPEEYWEQLFDYFQTVLDLDEKDVELIVQENWQEFYNKNIKTK